MKNCDLLCHFWQRGYAETDKYVIDFYISDNPKERGRTFSWTKLLSLDCDNNL